MSLNFEPVERVPLTRAPLAHVLCQVRFSSTPGLTDQGAAPRLRELLPEYPDVNQERGISITMPPLVDAAPQEIAQYVLRDVSGSWSVTVARDFVAIATTQYSDRHDFAERIRRVMDVLGEVARPAVVERIGVRYIDRLTQEDDVRDLGLLVRAPLLGCLPEASGGVEVPQQIVHVLARREDEEVLIRSLLLPPNALYDPLVGPEPVVSWVLDIDAYWSGRTAFDPASICQRQGSLGEKVHSTFRWSVTPAFLRRFE